MEPHHASNTSSRQGSSRPSPGLTLESLSFKNFGMSFKNKMTQPKMSQTKTRTQKLGNPQGKYTKMCQDEELQRNLANYELYFERATQPQKKSSYKGPKSMAYSNKSDIYFPKNYKDSNAEILSKILDSNNDLNSPSNLRLCQKELENIQKADNSKPFDSEERKGEEPRKLTIYQNIPDANDMLHLKENYIDAMKKTLTLLDPVFEELTLNEKIEKLVSLTEDERKNERLGALVCLYIIIKKYNKQIDDEHKNLVLEKVIQLLKNYNTQEELFLVACIEICSLFEDHSLLIENIGLICMFITDFNFPKLQRATFVCLMSIGNEGIRTLIELASKDDQDYQNYILNSLIQTPHIQKIIIIRALLNEVYSNDTQKRNSALAALNRMHDLVDDSDTLEKLEGFYSETKIKKDFISSVLRTSGMEGEMILLNEIKSNKSIDVRVSIANSFSYRLPKIPSYLSIRLDKNDTFSVTNNLPGSFCIYHGKVAPFIENKNYTIEQVLENEELFDLNESSLNTSSSEQNIEEYLEVNTRDFLAALQRMLIMNYDHANPQVVHTGNKNSIDNVDIKDRKEDLLQRNSQFFDLSGVNVENHYDQDDTNLDENGRYFVSEDIIKSLSRCLKDYSPKVRNAAATSLGLLGLPEAMLSIEGLIENLKDEDVDSKSKTIWAIGRIANAVDNGIIPYIFDSVQCNMWKVKKASLYTLGQIGDRCARAVLPYLLKLLKETAINKQLVAETIVKLGLEGESALLKLMTTEPDANYKLKGAVVSALAFSDINSSNIDFIVECIFKQGRNSNPLVRKAAIFAIKVLAEKAEENITYLKKKNVIPFYYDKLKDKDGSIQRVSENKNNINNPN